MVVLKRKNGNKKKENPPENKGKERWLSEMRRRVSIQRGGYVDVRAQHRSPLLLLLYFISLKFKKKKETKAHTHTYYPLSLSLFLFPPQEGEESFDPRWEDVFFSLRVCQGEIASSSNRQVHTDERGRTDRPTDGPAAAAHKRDLPSAVLLCSPLPFFFFFFLVLFFLPPPCVAQPQPPARSLAVCG